MDIKPKIAIIGGGPAGATLSLFLSKYKIDHVIFDKAVFPRDKVCGDGLTNEVYRTLAEIDPNLAQEYIQADFVQEAPGIVLGDVTGGGVFVDYKLKNNDLSLFYVSKRRDFDFWLLQKAKDKQYCEVIDGTEISKVEKLNGRIKLYFGSNSEVYDFVAGCDGERSVLKKHLVPGGIKKDKEHTVGAMRAYYKNVMLFDAKKPLEFYPIKGFKSGYFWIFHLPNNECNVGIGGLSSEIASSQVNLRKLFYDVIEMYPKLKKRFEHSIELEKPKGWGIPLNSKQQDYAGDGYVIIGDAANMAEPLSGKGIGVSMFVIYHIFPTLLSCYENKDFSKTSLNGFAEQIERVFGKQWRALHFIQKHLFSSSFVVLLSKFLKINLIRIMLVKLTADKMELFMKPKRWGLGEEDLKRLGER